MKTIKILLLLLSLSFPSAFAQSHGSRFPGFSRGQSGAGGILGYPIGGRYQRWIDWKTATFFSFGYSTEKFLMADANYAYYFLTEDDRWKANHDIGLIMYSAFAGITGGTYIGNLENEKARLGARIGGAFEYLLPSSNWTLRLEVAPVLYLSGRTTAGVQGGIVVMYYFDQPNARKKVPAAGTEVQDGISKSIIEGDQGADIRNKKIKKKKKKKEKSVEEELDL